MRSSPSCRISSLARVSWAVRSARSTFELRSVSASFAERSPSLASNTEINKVVSRSMKVKPAIVPASQTLLISWGSTVQMLFGAK